MKKHIGIKKGKLFISKPLLMSVLIFLGIIVVLSLVILRPVVFKNTSDASKRPLGIAPSGAEKVPDDPIAAAEFMTQKIKEEHLNKLVVIFYYDGYKSQTHAVMHANILADVLKTKNPFKELQDVVTFKILTSGEICDVVGKELVCEPRHIDALKKLGIDHIKIVVLHPEEFTPSFDHAFGADSLITIPTKQLEGESDAGFIKRIQGIFEDYLRKSLGTGEVQDDKEEYLKAALSCFYGSKESYKVDLLHFKNCKDFKSKYPMFWEHDVKIDDEM